MSRALKFSLRLVAGLGLLALILARIDGGHVFPRLTARVAGGVAAAAVLLIVSQAFAALRWRLILGTVDLPWSYLTRLYVIASFFSLLLPTSVGGDAVRMAAAAGEAERPGGVVASVVLDRLSGVLALLCYAVLGMGLAGGVPVAVVAGIRWRVAPWLVMVAGVGAVLAAGWAATRLARRSARVGALVEQARALVKVLWRSPSLMASVLLLALVVQGLVIAIWIVLARALGLELPITAFLVAVPVVTLGAMLPITLSGLGVREGIWLLLLGGSGLASATIVGFSLLYFATTLVVGLVGLGLFVTVGLRRPAKARAPGSSATEEPGDGVPDGRP